MTEPVTPHTRGQALVEFAVAIPVLILVAFALFDVGRIVIDYTTLTNASRVGARVAMVNQSNDASCGGVRTFKCATADHSGAMGIAPGDIQNVDIDNSADPACTEGGCMVTVTVSHSYQPVTPIIGSIVGPVSLSASTTMPMERAFASP